MDQFKIETHVHQLFIRYLSKCVVNSMQISMQKFLI